jgi:hypothetical protein
MYTATQSSRLTILGLSVFFVVAVCSSSKPDRLDDQALRAIRGGEQNLYSGFFLCAEFSSSTLTTCSTPGGNCTLCENDRFEDTGSTKGGGYKAPSTGGSQCGRIWQGICDTDKVCKRLLEGKTKDNCRETPKLPQQQAINP